MGVEREKVTFEGPDGVQTLPGVKRWEGEARFTDGAMNRLFPEQGPLEY